MKKYEAILKFLKDDLYKNHEKRGISQFFQSSLLHFAISLEVGINTYNENFISYEKICENIPKQFGSRSSIQTILNEAVNLNYFIKVTSEKDRRIKNYKFSNEYSEVILDWIEKNKSYIGNEKAA